MAVSRMRVLRMQRGLRLYELAALLGISESRLSLIETGRRALTDELKQRLANTLGVSPNLLGEANAAVLNDPASEYYECFESDRDTNQKSPDQSGENEAGDDVVGEGSDRAGERKRCS
jgi:transcriptional regulator with XRE-family HTH domain